jgi:class 3 adenylate cyclase
MSRRVHDALEAGREAIRRHDWAEARRLLTRADAESKLDGEGLRQLGKVMEWSGDVAATLDAFERSYAAFVAAGDRRSAAKVALMLRHVCASMLRDTAAARGWLQRAQHLLENEAECVELGYLWRAQGRTVFINGGADEGLTLLKKAIDLGRRLGSANLVAMSMTWLGISLCEIGRTDEASAYLDEACAAAVGGELGPWATGIVYCNSISAYRDVGELALAGEWTQTAGRWCQHESITGFSGICRVHRAEFMRLRGAWSDAEKEALLASGELEGNTPAWAGEAHYEIGEIRLRMGDLAGADEAFRHAHELARDPQPGAAMLLAARGEPAAALRSLETSNPSGVLDEMRCLVVKVDLACELGELETADAAVLKAEALAAELHGLGVQVLAVQAAGTVELARGKPEAHKTLRHALRMWQEIDAPYETALVRMLLARALGQTGDSAGARREGEAALATFKKLGAGPDVVRAKRALDEPANPVVTPTAAQRTLFFSDIVGSTQLAEAIGDEAWTGLVTWLDSAMRQCFADQGGEEVDHAGDGFFVAFPDSRAALDCAVSIQRKLADHRKKHGFAPQVRIGVHAATTSQGGGRYRGLGVHEASRIAALAGPDEIVASRATVPAGFSASEGREVTVKGISNPIVIVTIGWRR